VSAFVCLIEIRLHIADSRSLKAKRKHVHSIKDQLRQRFGAAVAEIDGHDTWQTSTLLCALVGDGEVGSRADRLEEFVSARFLDACTFEREIRSMGDLRG
jgi:uncharacterized protein YlxP (DUF503 family)